MNIVFKSLRYLCLGLVFSFVLLQSYHIESSPSFSVGIGCGSYGGCGSCHHHHHHHCCSDDFGCGFGPEIGFGVGFPLMPARPVRYQVTTTKYKKKHKRCECCGHKKSRKIKTVSVVEPCFPIPSIGFGINFPLF